jgi:hypothetical protein
MNEQHPPSDGPPTVVTADQLNALYAHHNNLDIADTTITATLEQHSRRQHAIVAAGIAALLLLTLADLIVTPDSIGVIVTAGGSVIIAAGTAGLLVTRRRCQQLHQQRTANSTERSTVLGTFMAVDQLLGRWGPLDPHVHMQAAEILRARHSQPELRPSAADCSRQLLYRTVHTLSVITPADYSSNAHTLLRHVSDDTLLFLGRWGPLAAHIYTELKRTQPGNTREGSYRDWELLQITRCATNYQTVATTLQQLLDEHGDDTIATANQLAADDRSREHTWTDIVNTAAALTPM